MAKEEAKEEAQVVEPKPEEKEEVKPEEEKPQPVTRKEYEQLLTDLHKSQSQWQSAQGIISKQKDEIKSLQDNQELWKVLIGMQAQQMGVSEEEAEANLQKRKPDLMQQFNVAQQQQETKRIQDKANSYRSIVEDELGLKEGDDDYEVIHSLVMKQKWDKADKKIEAIRTKKTEQPKEEKVEEPKEDKEKQIREDERRKVLEEHGLLEPEGGEPSSATYKSLVDIAKEYADNPTEANRKRYEEAVSKS